MPHAATLDTTTDRATETALDVPPPDAYATVTGAA
jgi:hypothetical protein